MTADTPLLHLSACQVDLTRREVRRGGHTLPLNPREAELLAWFVAHPVRPATRQELLREVWGYRGGARTRVVDMTVRRLREKLEADPADPQHVLTVRGMGYRFEPPAGGAALSPQRDPLFGREAALRALGERLQHPGLVTLLGPPGVGKTRLAACLAEGWSGPVVVVDAGACPRPEALQEALEASGAAALPPDGLVVIDHLERCAEAGRALSALRGRRALCTSLHALGVAEEQRVVVAPLDPAPALALLVDRARRAGLDEPLRWEAALKEIVALSDGLPLALELAAAQLAALQPPALLQRLRSRPLELASEAPDRPPRHHSLRRALEAAWALLDPEERGALATLSVFVGPFSVEAAEATLAPAERSGWQLLRRLTERSLLARAGDGRLRMLHAVRAFAAEHLGDARAAAERRHGLWACQLRGDVALAHLDELLAAMQRALDRSDLELATAGCRTLERLGAFQDPQQIESTLLRGRLARVRGALAQAEAHAELALSDSAARPDLQAQALHSLGWLRNLQGRLDEGIALLERAAARAQEDGDTALRASALCDLGVCRSEVGDRTGARVDLEAARALLQALGDPPQATADCVMSLGLLGLAEGAWGQAQAAFQDAAERYGALGVPLGRAWALNNLGEALRLQGQRRSAARAYEAALEGFRRVGSGDGFVAEANLALLQLDSGDAAGARAVLERTLRTVQGQGRRARQGLVHAMLLPCVALAGEQAALGRHLGEARRLLAETGFVDHDVARLAEQAAREAEARGWPDEARGCAALALDQRQALLG
ncbi:MAG: winged helix-turn-helix domain-containing protein [Alphaproteobacteria bacterium]|nr:winged helix-turn-helix domain-containing protein [Alphaproteobacteria bacterium]